MKLGQKFILLRYSNNIVPNTIEENQAVIDELGYCWFGKIGVVPSKRIQGAILAEDEPKIILYTRGVAHECTLLGITTDKPAIGCPRYYESEGIYPSVFFKLGNITSIDVNDLEKYRIISSGKSLSAAIWSSMTSYFFAEWKDPKKAVEVTSRVKKDKKEEKDLLPVNDCVYRVNGKCNLKSCINYKYECDRPSMCLKQKR